MMCADWHTIPILVYFFLSLRLSCLSYALPLCSSLHCFAVFSVLAVFFSSKCSLVAFIVTLALSVLTLKVIAIL